jgi:hypothetical protein
VRKLLKELFYIPKYGKVSDKAMLTRVVTTVLIMVCCLAAMGISAYAYFSFNVSSDANVIQAARFEAEVLIQYEDGENGTVDLLPNDQRIYLLQPGISYTVTLKLSSSSTARTGYVVITDALGHTRYHSQQLGEDASAPEGRRETVRFTVSVTKNAELTFLSHWGTSSLYQPHADQGNIDDKYLADGESVVLEFEQQPPMMSAKPSVTEPTEGTTEPTEESKPVQPTYQLNYTDITANVGWVTTLQLLDTSTGTPLEGLDWHVSEPEYISIEIQSDGVKVTGTAGTVGVEGVGYGCVWCEYQGETYTCVFRIKNPNNTATEEP